MADSNANPLVGTVSTGFELHSFHKEQWLLVKDSPDLRELQPVAALLVERQEVDGIRLVRRRDYVDHGFATTTTILKKLRGGVAEVDPLMPATPGRDLTWCDTTADFRKDAQREVMRTLLAKYLDDQHLTPIEILYVEANAKALMNAGTTVQGALQRLSSLQVRGTRQSAVDRLKELMALADKAFLDLQMEIKEHGTPDLANGQLGKVVAAVDPEGTNPSSIYRAMALHLKGAKTYAEKLDRLFRLVSPSPGFAELRLVDTFAAELLSSPLALKELREGQGTRYDLVLNLIDLHAGRVGDVEKPPGIALMSAFLQYGILPRTLAEMRFGVLRHLHARVPLREKDLWSEVQSVRDMVAHMNATAPGLAADEEVQDALQQRLDRLIQPEAMGEYLGGGRGVLAKIDKLVDLLDALPSPVARSRVAPYFKTLVVADDILREGGNGVRPNGLPALSNVIRRVSAAPMPDAAKRELLEPLDSAAADVARLEIMGQQQVPYYDRVLSLLRNCAGMPEGKGRQFAVETMAMALKRPEFMPNYLQRFKQPEAQKKALDDMMAALKDSGLVPPAMMPTAA